jgi:hypothetical protein
MDQLFIFSKEPDRSTDCWHQQLQFDSFPGRLLFQQNSVLLFRGANSTSWRGGWASRIFLHRSGLCQWSCFGELGQYSFELHFLWGKFNKVTFHHTFLQAKDGLTLPSPFDPNNRPKLDVPFNSVTAKA